MLIALATALLTGCATGTSVIDTSCSAFFIIRPSRLDTPETLDQIGLHNETYRRVCPDA